MRRHNENISCGSGGSRSCRFCVQKHKKSRKVKPLYIFSADGFGEDTA